MRVSKSIFENAAFPYKAETDNGRVVARFQYAEDAEAFVKLIEERPKRVRLMAGGNHIHIAKDGVTLCKRSPLHRLPLAETTNTKPTCPGCIAKSLGIVARAEASQ